MKTETIAFRVSPEERRLIDQLARREERTRSDAIRRLIRQAVQNYERALAGRRRPLPPNIVAVNEPGCGLFAGWEVVVEIDKRKSYIPYAEARIDHWVSHQARIVSIVDVPQNVPGSPKPRGTNYLCVMS
jgi:hypothetical protein